MNNITCITFGCRNQRKGVVIGRTNGTAGEFYCAECRKWTLWTLDRAMSRISIVGI